MFHFAEPIQGYDGGRLRGAIALWQNGPEEGIVDPRRAALAEASPSRQRDGATVPWKRLRQKVLKHSGRSEATMPPGPIKERYAWIRNGLPS